MKFSQMQIKPFIKILFLCNAIFCASTWAQSNNAVSAKTTTTTSVLDTQLVGTWEGEFKEDKSDKTCFSYKWKMERKKDGTYHYWAYDNSQSLLNDEGHWWVDDKKSLYFETVTGQTDEPTVYRYNVAQTNFNGGSTSAEFVQTSFSPANECKQTTHFTENKTNL